MGIQGRIDKIKPLFIEMRVIDDVIYIKVKISKIWSIPKGIEELFNVGYYVDQSGDEFFYANIKETFDKVFDAIDYTIEFNEIANKKLELLKQKINELQELFATRSFDELMRLDFTFQTKRKKRIEKQTNVIIVESVDSKMGEINVEQNGGDTVDDNKTNQVITGEPSPINEIIEEQPNKKSLLETLNKAKKIKTK